MLNEFESKMVTCFHFFSEPNDHVKIKINLDKDHRNVIFETYSTIPIANKMSIEQFLNTPVDTLKAIAKGLYKDIKVVG
tara:strand:- start:661 stop:897 length:237 start_codon:yes stop_codon:yes gene_type:complete